MQLLVQRLFPTLQGKWGKINLADAAKPFDWLPINHLIDPEFCRLWVESLHQVLKIDYSYGGYLENRAKLWRGSYLTTSQAIHFGIDFYVPVNTKVCLPVDGAMLLYSQIDPDQLGGWGGKLIFKHENLYLTFGHLKNIPSIIKDYDSKEIIGQIAETERNGGWGPHLHLQVSDGFYPDADGYGSTESTKSFFNPEEVL